MVRSSLAMLGCAAVVVGCAVDVADSPVGKPCPCPDPFVCAGGVCEEPSAGPTGGASGCTPLVTVADFAPDWSTPETIRWIWSSAGNAEDFVEYRVTIASSEADVTSGGGSAQVFDKTVNPELAFFIVPHEDSPFPVTHTVTDGLDPLAPASGDAGHYFAALSVVDVAGCTYTTPIAQATTKLPPTEGVWLFDDLLEGELFGAPMVVTPACGPDGSPCLACSSRDCLDTDPVGEGWDHLRLVQPLGLDAVTENAFESGQAYVEAKIAVVSPTPAFYTELYVAIHPELEFWGHRRIHLRADPDAPTFQTVQVPLRELVDENGTALTFATLQAGLDEFQIGGGFVDATDVFLDAVAVRW